MKKEIKKMLTEKLGYTYHYEGEGLHAFVLNGKEYAIHVLVDDSGEFDTCYFVKPVHGDNYFNGELTNIKQVKDLLTITEKAENTMKMVRQML